ncbi:MAG: SGNH/GDSL hydrolase family protein [Patescibacteria group bacterium]|nr:SGNH/GDSL hydrolase family protein [Patescibacteria group bacterium]
MLHKKINYLMLILAILLGYLYLSHTLIYYRIHSAHLQATNNKYSYDLISNPADENILIYAAVGDSLTAGVGTSFYEESYPYLLANKISAEGKNIIHENFSYPGARTENIVNDFLNPIIEAQPNIITLLIGTNDIHGKVNVKQFEENYEFILKELSSKTNAKIYLLSIPHIGSNTLILPPYNYYFNYKENQFNRVIYALGLKYEVQYINLTDPTTKSLKSNGVYYAADSFHPSALGYADWANIIYANIN